MLDVANKYKESIEELYYNTWYNDKYKFYHNSCFREKRIISDNNWNDCNFVSINKNKRIIGLIGYQIDRTNDFVSCLWIINFSDNKMTFGKDVGKVIDDIFNKFNFRKIEFSVVVGNPIEKSYDKLIHKYGGRVVGVYKQHTKLIDNKLYDEKIYEIFREDYINHNKKGDLEWQ
jgi:RimJ/RimL family protein N-acetyltransferase